MLRALLPWLTLPLAALAPLAACGGASTDDPPGGGGDEVVAETFALDGVLLMHHQVYERIGQGNAERAIARLYLLDPNTGALSPRAWDARHRAGWAVSPDGRFVAYREPDGRDTRDLVLLRVGFDAEQRPTLTEVRRWDTTGPRHEDTDRWLLAFSGDGRRLHTERQWLDPEADQVLLDCADHVQGEDRLHLSPLPDGRHFVCVDGSSSAASVLFDDGVALVLPLGDVGGGFSADGQLWGPRLHVPSRTLGDRDAFAGSYATWGPAVPWPELGGLHASSGWQGTGWSAEVGTGAGGIPVQVCNSQTSADRPEALSGYDWADNFAQRTMLPTLAFEAPGQALPPIVAQLDGEHRAWELIGVVGPPERREAIYDLEGRDWVPGCPPHSTVVDRRFVGVDLTTGDVRQVDLHTLAPGVFTSGGYRVLPFGASGWVAVHDRLGQIAGHDDQPFVFDRPARLTDDNAFLLSPVLWDPVQGAEAMRVCVQPARPGATRHCMDHPSQGEPVAIVGQGTHPAHPTGPPRLLARSQVAAYEGQTVTLTGVRFGAAGTVTLGGQPVPEGNVLSWSDTRIALRSDAALPPAGPLVVQTADGSSEAGFGLWFHPTPLVQSPLGEAPAAAFTVAQGLSAVDLGEVEAAHLSAPPGLVLDPEVRTEDGRYVVYAGPVTAPMPVQITVHGGPEGAYSRALTGTHLPGLASTDGVWQPVAPVVKTAAPLGFRPLAGQPVEVGDLTAPVLTEAGLVNPKLQVSLPKVNPWFETPDGALYMGTSLTAMRPWHRITEVHADGTVTEAPLGLSIHSHLSWAAALDDRVLFTGMGPEADSGAAFALYRLQPGQDPTLVAEGGAPEVTRFEQAIAVERQGAPYFLVFARGTTDAFYALSPEGELLADFAPAMSDSLPSAWGELLAASGPVVVALQGGSPKVAVRLDLDAATPDWQPLVPPALAAGAQLVSASVDGLGQAIVLVLSDGRLVRLTAADGYQSPEVVDLGASLTAPLSLPLTPTPTAAVPLDDGRWLLHAAFDEAPFFSDRERFVLITPAP